MSDSEWNEVREYLLGRLTQDAAEGFEERFFASDELLRALGEQQHELIDDYLAGSLSAADEDIFRTQMERSTSLKHKVEVHRRLLWALERRPVSSYEGRRVERWRWVWLGVACAAVAVAGGGFLLRHSKEVRTPIQVATVAEPLPAPRQSAAAAVPDAVFFLSGSVTRGADSRPLLKIPASAKLVELQVELPVGAGAVAEWQLADLDGRVPALPAPAGETQHQAGVIYVAVRLPAESLPNGDHAIRLTGMPATGTAGGQVIVRAFRVNRIHDTPVQRAP